MKSVSIILPFPPSVNHTWLISKKRLYLQKDVRYFRKNVLDKIMEERLKKNFPVEKIEGDIIIETVLIPKDKRRRDLDNYAKCLYDALTKADVWHDDSQIKREIREFGDPDKKNPRVEIKIIWDYKE